MVFGHHDYLYRAQNCRNGCGWFAVFLDLEITAFDLEAASAFVANFDCGARASRIWRAVKSANQLLSVGASACAYLEIVTKGVETLVILSYFEED